MTRPWARRKPIAVDQAAASPPVYPVTSYFEGAQPPDLLHVAPVSTLLRRRLSPAAEQQITAQATPEQLSVRAGAQPHHRGWVELAIGVDHQVPDVLRETGLRAAVPPEHVHAMGRGWLASGGSYAHADLVVDALSHAGLELAPGMAGLDFGCSSGRVVRVLEAAYPEVRWLGCDPNAEAIEWAGTSLPGIEFFASPLRPPLPLEKASLDLAYAISIWSHFDHQPALAWFDEMHRLLKPGGVLVFTAHGRHSIAHYLDTGHRDLPSLELALTGMLRETFWYRAEFGEAGDHGVRDSGWGTAFMSAEWVLAHLSPAWDVLRCFPGREDGNQDVYVLRRRSPVSRPDHASS